MTTYDQIVLRKVGPQKNRLIPTGSIQKSVEELDNMETPVIRWPLIHFRILIELEQKRIKYCLSLESLKIRKMRLLASLFYSCSVGAKAVKKWILA